MKLLYIINLVLKNCTISLESYMIRIGVRYKKTTINNKVRAVEQIVR